jgi:phosphoglycolate phosphatase-like HAD superfamily hydrolase
VLLDQDGTITDPKPGILGGCRHAPTALGHPVPSEPELTWVIGPPLRTAFPRILGPGCDVERWVALYREYLGARGRPRHRLRHPRRTARHDRRARGRQPSARAGPPPAAVERDRRRQDHEVGE